METTRERSAQTQAPPKERVAAGAAIVAALAAVARKLGVALGEPAGLGHHHLTELAAVLLFLLVIALVLGGAALIVLGSPRLAALPPALKAAWCAAAGAGIGCILYGTLVEPFQVTVRRVDIESPKVLGRPLRIVHLSDLHVRRWSRIEEQVLQRVRGLEPDLILLTGDYTAFPGRVEDAWWLLRRLSALAPAYAVRGNTDFNRRLPMEAETGPAWLLNRTERLELSGTPLSVTGVDPGLEWRVWELTKGLDRRRLNLFLYHFPDLAPEVGRYPYDLMLFGHTHGGQVRLPWIGALMSLSRAGTRYASGLFQKNGKSAFVSQGIGCESFGLPRLRFLCPPEVALIVISPPAVRRPS